MQIPHLALTSEIAAASDHRSNYGDTSAYCIKVETRRQLDPTIIRSLQAVEPAILKEHLRDDVSHPLVIVFPSLPSLIHRHCS